MYYLIRIQNFIDRIYCKRFLISILVIIISTTTSLGNNGFELYKNDKDLEIPETIAFNEVNSVPSLSQVEITSSTEHLKDTKASSVDTLSDQDPTTSVTAGSDTPNKYKLEQNYPNPFNPATEITYQLPSDRHVVLKVYDILGRPVKTLVNKTQKAGSYTVRFNAEGLTSGMYLYRLEAGNYEQIRKMILIK